MHSTVLVLEKSSSGDSLGQKSCMRRQQNVLLLQEIYPGNKTTHFRRIHSQSKIEYKDMLFFDNERRNCIDVGKLGVVCVYTPHGELVTSFLPACVMCDDLRKLGWGPGELVGVPWLGGEQQQATSAVYSKAAARLNRLPHHRRAVFDAVSNCCACLRDDAESLGGWSCSVCGGESHFQMTWCQIAHKSMSGARNPITKLAWVPVPQPPSLKNVAISSAIVKCDT